MDTRRAFTAIDVNGVDRLTQRMAQHTEQGIVILTTHQPLNVAESKIRRISLTQTGPHDVLAHFPS